MWASADTLASVKKFETSSVVDDFKPIVVVPFTDSLSGSPAMVGTTMLPSRKMLERRKSMSIPFQAFPKRLLGQKDNWETIERAIC